MGGETMKKIISLVILVSLISLNGCQKMSYEGLKWYEGTLVRHKTDGRLGIIVGWYGYRDCYSCRRYGQHAPQYQVKFGVRTSTTNTHILDRDGAISDKAYTTSRCYPYELELVKLP